MFGHIAQDQPRPAKDMGLVQDCDVIGQGLEVYHGDRVASVGVHGKMLKGLGPDFSVVTAPCDQKHLQILKMFAAIFPFACVVVSTRHSVISANGQLHLLDRCQIGRDILAPGGHLERHLGNSFVIAGLGLQPGCRVSDIGGHHGLVPD